MLAYKLVYALVFIASAFLAKPINIIRELLKLFIEFDLEKPPPFIVIVQQNTYFPAGLLELLCQALNLILMLSTCLLDVFSALKYFILVTLSSYFKRFNDVLQLVYTFLLVSSYKVLRQRYFASSSFFHSFLYPGVILLSA